MLGNPAITAMVQRSHDAQLVASLVQPWGTRFAGVIITTPATGIKSVADLRGKKLITLVTASAAGHMFQRDYLLTKGFDVAKDFSAMKEVPRQDDVLLAVKSGNFDVGFCRTGIIEDMVRKGKAEMGDFVVIGKVDDPEYPFVRTTELYPEWYMTVLPGGAPALTAKVKTALMALKPDSKVSEALGIKGFQEPLAINQVTDLLTRLKIAPFNN
jgi:ABC-type phosphate/phosphonate transport system substrate-binding protein